MDGILKGTPDSISRSSNKLFKYPHFSYNKQDTSKPRGLIVEILDIKHGIETLCDRLGKTQDYL